MSVAAVVWEGAFLRRVVEVVAWHHEPGGCGMAQWSCVLGVSAGVCLKRVMHCPPPPPREANLGHFDKFGHLQKFGPFGPHLTNQGGLDKLGLF